MFWLRLPIPLQKTPITYSTPNTTISSNSNYYCHQSFLPYSSKPVTKCSTISMAFKDEMNGETFVDEDFSELEPLPGELKAELMPKHVAVIMDGNGRWAKMKGLPVSAGHVAGMDSFKRMLELCSCWGIKVLTIFAFSSDNWNRPKVEVDFLFDLLERLIHSQIENWKRKGIKVSVIGDTSKLPNSLQRIITSAEENTKKNSKFQLIMAVNYGGKLDVVQACKRVVKKVKDELILLEDIDENILEKELETNCTEFPYPDLLIRTSGELRVSNFLLWQLAYTEFFFHKKLWPDFGKDEFIEALISFQHRRKRHGG
ncbi:dehydrodolichyl diphosphate synthase 2-like [Vicia villosa]|uniref:dehydrodolichyl diphosphate synthase 2-like n=1 Tax=Vicia villosa TaxID=3911 RepID=UPI00273C769B|nr:dehydrodolichyl diphosphate synthase 2-like [Vicia villosa]